MASTASSYNNLNSENVVSSEMIHDFRISTLVSNSFNGDNFGSFLNLTSEEIQQEFQEFLYRMNSELTFRS
jgi:hypothetical protein